MERFLAETLGMTGLSALEGEGKRKARQSRAFLLPLTQPTTKPVIPNPAFRG